MSCTSSRSQSSSPQAGEIRIRIEAFAVNPLDQMMRSGTSPAPVPLPHARLGIEGTGVVDALGPEVTGLEIGDPVILTAIPDATVTGQLRRIHHGPRQPGHRPAGRARSHGGGGDLGRVLHRLRRARREGGDAARRPRPHHGRVRRRRPGGDADRQPDRRRAHRRHPAHRQEGRPARRRRRRGHRHRPRRTSPKPSAATPAGPAPTSSSTLSWAPASRIS